MKGSNFTALFLTCFGLMWVSVGLDHAGIVRIVELGVGSVLLAVTLVLLEFGKWTRL